MANQLSKAIKEWFQDLDNLDDQQTDLEGQIENLKSGIEEAHRSTEWARNRLPESEKSNAYTGAFNPGLEKKVRGEVSNLEVDLRGETQAYRNPVQELVPSKETQARHVKQRQKLEEQLDGKTALHTYLVYHNDEERHRLELKGLQEGLEHLKKRKSALGAALVLVVLIGLALISL